MPRWTRSCVRWRKQKGSAVLRRRGRDAPRLPAGRRRHSEVLIMPSKIKNSKRSRLRLSLPATSANLGPAFDAAALAMDFYIKIDARAGKDYSIEANGRDCEICGNLQEHLILNTYREVLEAAGRKITPLEMRIANDIPIGKGCGSSAAARLAGIALAVHFGHLRWTDAQIVGEASRREHHPDNAPACWMGGLTVAQMS